MEFPWSFADVVRWMLFGFVQLVRERIPLIDPAPLYFNPPDWWWWWNGWADWYGHVDSRNVPDRAWCESWVRSCWLLLERWIDWQINLARSQTEQAIRNFTGRALHNFATISAWVEDVWLKVGVGRTWFASNLTEAVNWVAGKLPEGIKQGWQSWDSWLDGLGERVKQWVRTQYDNARAYAIGAYAWVLDRGEALSRWQDSVSGFLDSFRANPAGVVAAWLGDTWARLATFSRSALQYYYNLWGRHATTLSEFLADPLGFLYDRVEDYLCNKW